MAGGLGTRLGRLTNGSVNKHRLAVYDKPMIELTIETLARGGVTEALLLLNGTHPELLLEILEDGEQFGIELTYRYVKDVRAGPGRHLKLAQTWVNHEPFVLMLGDSFFTHTLDFRVPVAPHLWTMPLNGLDDPSKYGQVVVEGSRVVELVEKPKELFSNTIQVGVWVFPSDVFELIDTLSTRLTGELQIGDLSMHYVKEGRMTHTPIPAGSYLDLGTHDSLLRAANIVAHERSRVPSATL